MCYAVSAMSASSSSSGAGPGSGRRPAAPSPSLGGWRIACGGRTLGGDAGRGLLLALAVAVSGCDEPTADLRSSVELLTAERGEVAERAYQRIERHGRTALPYLEAALHRVAPPGRRSVVTALRRLALPESAALLGHIAAFDADPQVRAEAYSTLEAWAADGRPTAAATAARTALRQVDEARSPP